MNLSISEQELSVDTARSVVNMPISLVWLPYPATAYQKGLGFVHDDISQTDSRH